MRSVWEECTVDTGTPGPPAVPEEAERNEVAELAGSKGVGEINYKIKNYNIR